MKYIQAKFPTMGEMVAFIRSCHPVVNDYNFHTETLTVEDTEQHRYKIEYYRGIIIELPAAVQPAPGSKIAITPRRRLSGRK